MELGGDMAGDSVGSWTGIGVCIITIYFIHAQNYQRMNKNIIKIINAYLKNTQVTCLNFQWPWYYLNLCWTLLFDLEAAEVSDPELPNVSEKAKGWVGRHWFGPGLVCSWQWLPPKPFLGCQINAYLVMIKPPFAVLFLECGVSKPHGPISQFVSLQSPNIAAAWDSRPALSVNRGKQLLLRSLDASRAFNFLTKVKDSLPESHLSNV